MLQLALAAVVGLGAGLSIGCIGVGGVVIVPALVAAGVPIHAAIAAAMAGFIVTGTVGTAVFVRRGSIDGRAALPTLLAAMPAAVLGAVAAQVASGLALELAIGGLTGLSGLHILWRSRGDVAAPLSPPSASTSVAAGAVAGFLSALTGTGGPAILLPILLWLDVPVLAAVGLGQAIQLPVAMLATIGNVAVGAVREGLAVPLGLGLGLGAWGGARLAHALDQALLRRLVALVLLGVGLLMLGRVALRLA